MLVDPHARALLTAIVQVPVTHEQQDIASLARAIADWDTLIDFAREHRILPLLLSRINGMDASIPREAQERLRSEYDRNAFHTLANAAELVRLLRAFEQQNIPAMPFKGVVLAASFYPSLTMRSAGDLDFLIFYRDLAPATSMLIAKGYELKTEVREDGSPANPDYYEFHFERSSDGMVVELRWRLELIQPRFRRDLGMEWTWPRRRTVSVAGAEAPNLDPVSNLLILCMHGTKHLWSRMIWVCDIARLVAAHPELDWKEVTQEAKQRGLWRALALGVLLAQRICGTAIPEAPLEQFASDRAVHELAEYFRRNMFEESGRMPPTRIPYNLRILDSGDRIRWLLTMEFLRPNERDLAVVRLPNVLYPLYFLVRPFRVLFDRSAR
jgi:hypothetical protein